MHYAVQEAKPPVVPVGVYGNSSAIRFLGFATVGLSVRNLIGNVRSRRGLWFNVAMAVAVMKLSNKQRERRTCPFR